MKYIEYNCKNRIGYITFLREEKRNALNDQFIKELSKTITLAEKDNKCKIIIIQNKGNVFCAGADLKYLKEINLKKNKENITDSKNLPNEGNNLLNQLQQDILFREPRRVKSLEMKQDESIMVLACSNPRREVEAVANLIWDWIQ